MVLVTALVSLLNPFALFAFSCEASTGTWQHATQKTSWDGSTTLCLTAVSQ